jgi:GNAT superfamily N-acetyltransferase
VHRSPVAETNTRDASDPPNWRPATPADDESIVDMCLALNEEEAGPERVCAAEVRRTLAALRADPWRGRAVVSTVGGKTAGYALLVAFWSNELGGEVGVLDELYVRPSFRRAGLSTELLRELLAGVQLWPGHAVALGLEVSPEAVRVREWYRRPNSAAGNLALVARRAR